MLNVQRYYSLHNLVLAINSIVRQLSYSVGIGVALGIGRRIKLQLVRVNTE